MRFKLNVKTNYTDSISNSNFKNFKVLILKHIYNERTAVLAIELCLVFGYGTIKRLYNVKTKHVNVGRM